MEASQEGIGNTIRTTAGKMADFLLLNRTDAHFAMRALKASLAGVKGSPQQQTVKLPEKIAIGISFGGVIPTDPTGNMHNYRMWTEAVCSANWYNGCLTAQRDFCLALDSLETDKDVRALRESITTAKVPQSMPNFNATLLAVRFPMMGGFALDGEDPDLDKFEYLFGAGRAAANWPNIGAGRTVNPEHIPTDFPVLSVRQMQALIEDMIRAYKAIGAMDKIMGNAARQDLTAAMLDRNIDEIGGTLSPVTDAEYLFFGEKKTAGFAHYVNRTPRSTMASIEAMVNAIHGISYNIKHVSWWLGDGPVRTLRAYYRWIFESIQAHGVSPSMESVPAVDPATLPPSARW